MDELGRFTLPMELRRALDIHDHDRLQIFVDGDCIILRKCDPACVFCGDSKEIRQFKDKGVCPKCLSMVTIQVP